MTQLLAVFVTVTALAMTAVAAWDRGGTAIDRLLLMALSLALCLGTHLIPALSKRSLAWLLWAGCLLGTIYGHVTFFTHASLRASELRVQHSALVVGTERQIVVIRESLESIKSRPVTTVAAELSSTRDKWQRRALREELAEAKRAAALRDELVSLTGSATTAEVTGAVDPVTARLVAVTGSNEASIVLLVGLGFSILLELMGALLWFEVFRPTQEVIASVTKAPITNSDDHITTLRAAIASGKCRATVSGIRSFLGCSQSRASELRRALQ
jgi:hypothetical protein